MREGKGPTKREVRLHTGQALRRPRREGANVTVKPSSRAALGAGGPCRRLQERQSCASWVSTPFPEASEVQKDGVKPVESGVSFTDSAQWLF